MTHENDGISAAFALLNPQPADSTSASGEGAASATEPMPPSPEVQALEAERDAAKGEAAQLREQLHRRDLAGKVSDVDLALKVLDPAKHLDAQGNIRLDVLREEFPGLYPRGVMHPTAPDGGGGSQRMPDMGGGLTGAVRTGSLPLINIEFDRALRHK
ncbi:MAG: hypothetical protein Q4C67_03715 [Deinococcus sp.]|nr:hypothetical protein [Deinococcus sp.]